MKYTVQSIKYIIKNFFYVIPFTVLPAVFLAFSLDKPAIERIAEGYFSGKPHASFPELFHAISIFNFRSIQAFIMGFIGVVCMILCGALMFAMIDKHMRIGRRTWNGVFSKLNDNLISTFGICILYVAVYELWSLITSALLFLVMLPDSKVVVYILSVLVFLAMHFILLYVVSIFYLWLPCLQITGFRSLWEVKLRCWPRYCTAKYWAVFPILTGAQRWQCLC